MSSSDEEDERLADDGPLDASDKRVRWLAEKVSAGLGCDVGLFASCVANDDETRDRVEAFVRGALLRPRLSRRIPPQRHPRRARVGSIHGSRGLLPSPLPSFPLPTQSTPPPGLPLSSPALPLPRFRCTSSTTPKSFASDFLHPLRSLYDH